MRTNARVGHTFSFWPSVWRWSVKLHTSAEEHWGGGGGGAEAGSAQRLMRCPLISSYERGVSRCLRSHLASSWHLRNWCGSWYFRDSQEMALYPWQRLHGRMFQLGNCSVPLSAVYRLKILYRWYLMTCLSMSRKESRVQIICTWNNFICKPKPH